MKTHLAVFEPVYGLNGIRIFVDIETLCKRTADFGGHLVADERDLDYVHLCKRCRAVWLKFSTYKDFV